jgi:importin-9
MVLFQTTWEELSKLRPTYLELFINDERQGRLEDADGLPYTLDFLVSDELDFLEILLKAPPVKAELQSQLKQAADQPHSVNWMQEILQLVVTYAQITTEEEGLWEIDVNLFLSEETAVTANYTPRVACAALIVQGLVEWLKEVPIEALLVICRALSAEPSTTLVQPQSGILQLTNILDRWKAKEAALFVLNQCLRDFSELDRKISPNTALGFQEFLDQSQQDPSVYLRARAFAVAGVLARTTGEPYTEKAIAYLNAAIQTLAAAEAPELIRVSCIRATQDLVEALPQHVTKALQPQLIDSISSFISSQDMSDPEVDDLKVSLVETLRDAIMIDVTCTFTGPAIDLLFTLASHGASNFQISLLVTETFEVIVSSVTKLGHEPYVRLCEKTIPSLTGAFDVGNMTQESALTNLAAELVSALAEFGSEPLPDGFVAAVMPKLNRVLLESTDAELVRPSTLAVKHMLAHGPAQFLAWSDPVTKKDAVETTLIIIDRLLNSSVVDDNAAAEVGGLAAELVERAGGEKLGPFLLQLLRAVALRLATAEKAQFIQSLIMVFARLSIASPKDVIDFLSQVDIHGENGLNVVMAKWLENSVNFAGYDAIRQNVVALGKLYSLDDPRIRQVGVKGDLIVQETDRIKTRSQAKANPDRWTTIPANLKILKVLVDELTNASTNRFNPSAAAAALDSEGSDDGDEWDDVGAGSTGALDLGLGMTKQELMTYDEEDSPTNSRGRDDETSEYLMGWFREEAQKPGFGEMFAMLNDEEREKLQKLGGS